MSSASTDSQANVSVDQAGHTAVHRLHGSVNWGPGNAGDLNQWGFRHGYSVGAWGEFAVGSSTTDSGPVNDYTGDVTITADTGYVFRAYFKFWSTVEALADWITFTSYAVDMTASAPGSSVITVTTATVSCDFYPNTNVSTATVKMQYRVQGSGTWLDAPGGTGAYQTYSQYTISRNLTGLVANTTYEIRLLATRNTTNSTTFNSSTSTFTTLADIPSITTDPASSISPTTATLNGTVNPHGASSTYNFSWGTTTGYGNNTATQGPSTSSSAFPFSAAISGLVNGTIYHYRANATGPGGSVFGADVIFTYRIPGSVWVEGTDLHWSDENGNEWKYTGTSVAVGSPGLKGCIWVEVDDLHYIDNSNEERKIVPILGSVRAALAGSVWVQTVTHMISWVTSGLKDAHADPAIAVMV